MASTRVVSAEEKELNEKTELRPSFIQRLIQKCGCLTEVRLTARSIYLIP